MQVYQGHIVKNLNDFYEDVHNDLESYVSIYRHLFAVAERMWEGVMSENQAVFSEISNYHPDYLGKDYRYLLDKGLTKEDCRLTVAREYGFKDWETVEAIEEVYDLDFEDAIENILSGDLEALKIQINKFPELLTLASQYGHKATLLHYCSSNGFEMYRQKVPVNLVETMTWLLEKGADREAKMLVYDGAFTTLELLITSAHPKIAGIMEELEAVLNPK